MLPSEGSGVGCHEGSATSPRESSFELRLVFEAIFSVGRTRTCLTAGETRVCEAVGLELGPPRGDLGVQMLAH